MILGLPTSLPKPGGVSAPPATAHNQAGESAKRFGEQDGRLAQLEAQFSTLQREQQAIRAEVSGSAERLQAQLDDVKSECSLFQANFSQQIQDNMPTLQAAQAAQQTQMSQGIADLKAMLQAQASPRPPKRSAPQGERPMDWQPDS